METIIHGSWVIEGGERCSNLSLNMILGSGSDRTNENGILRLQTLGILNSQNQGCCFGERRALYFIEKQVECLLTEYASE